MIAAEQGDGWLAECDDARRFLIINEGLVDTLSSVLRRLAGDGPVLEICAGTGELARSLGAAGIRVQATDTEPPESSEVLRMSADDALRHFRPKVVLGVFVPFDAGVDEAVLACPSVEHYVVLNARIGGSLGSSALWQAMDWKSEPLEAVHRWMLTRHDVWLGQPGRTSGDLLRHGEAWHFARNSSTISEKARR